MQCGHDLGKAQQVVRDAVECILDCRQRCWLIVRRGELREAQVDVDHQVLEQGGRERICILFMHGAIKVSLE